MSPMATSIPITEIAHMHKNNGTFNVRNSAFIMVRSWGTFPPENVTEISIEITRRRVR